MRPGTLALIAVPLLTAGCASGVPTATTAVLAGDYLQRFETCDGLLDYFRDNAADLVGPYGLGPGAGHVDEASAAGDGASAGSSGDDSAGGAPVAADSVPQHSTTNNQEEGVDEADIVKTDGRVIVTASMNGKVQVVDIASQSVIATIEIPGRGEHSSELLLNGSTLVILSTEWHGGGGPAEDLMPAFPATRTVVTKVDLSEPSAPKTLGSVRVEGSYRSARMIGDSVRLVLVSEPTGLTFTYPKDGSLQAEDDADRANRAIVADSDIDDWIPHLQVLDTAGQGTETRPLVDCADISRPREFSGLSTLAVVTFDVGGDTVAPSSTTGLVATGSTIYASTERLVVATSPWELWAQLGSEPGWQQDEVETDLHSFDISDPGRTAYQASGTVEGHLVNQFALSETDGVIRVATTTDGRSAEQSQSSLVVLREDGQELVEAGRVDGLGLTEQIRSVRYLGPDLAAVVTFRQTDPLYLIDTSDPADPRVRGELKIPGYSAYLHPLGDGHLLGVGQDADEETGETRGLQVSLFDVRDPAAPTRVSNLTWKDTYSPVEWDHRAFLYWEPTAQFFVPAERWSESKDEMFIGVITGTADSGALTEGPRASTSVNPSYGGGGALRTLVIDDSLWVVGYEGQLSRFDLSTMQGGVVVEP